MPQTLFAIGSATKAFTATTLGILHDDGVLDWETPVVDMLPEFRLHDPFASREMTAVDLLTHRSGLPRHDLLWYVTTLDRDELLERLRYLEPSEPFRAAFQYQNLMYMTAGILAGHLADTTWEAVTRARLLDPLGMDDATFSVAEIQERPDAARPYGGGLDTTRLLDYKPLDAIGPAGSINASVEDMTAWVRLQLGDGTVGGQEIVTGSTLDFIHAPQVVVSGRRPLAEAPYLMYGLGWFVEPFRGRKMIHHGGNIDGFSALVGFMPDEDLGMVVLTNKNGSPLPRILMLTAFDRILEGDDAVDWNQRLLEQRDAAEDDNGEEETPAAEDDATRVEDTTPSHPLADYAGTYEDPGYGPITVTHADDRLTATYYTVSGTLEHFHYDTFVLTVPQLDSMEVKLTFHTNAEGDIDRLAVPVEMSLDPVTFERVASETLSDPAYLEQFVGSYALRGQTITIALEGAATLTMTVPGQPTYTLVPYKEDGFEIEQLSGFRVLFEQEDGRVVRLLSVQPNGTFAAERIEDGAADGS
jgi:CubicO group peptidase (beta-lactamase class C family)